MANGDISTARIGSTIPLAYGPVRATGQKLLDFTLPSTTTIQAYALAEGEWDGPDNLYINGQVFSLTDFGTPANTAVANPLGVTLPGQITFSFHPGIDTPKGTPFTPNPVPLNFYGTLVLNPDQALDYLWTAVPDVVNRLMYSRLAYYFVTFKPNPGSTSTTLSPVGDWRSTRCRIFDANGNQTGYGYTTNPAWHFVDSWLRRVIKPEYGITAPFGADRLSTTEAACFDWGSIAESAAYYDQVLANGKKRFEGAYAFASQTTLAAIHEQILLCCRSYQQEYAGKIYLKCDKPRPSTFLLDERHIFPGTFKVDQKQVHASANRYVGAFLDLDIPVIAKCFTMIRQTAAGVFPAIASIITYTLNPCAANDIIEIAGADQPLFNGVYRVTGVNAYQITAANYDSLDTAVFGTSGTLTSTGGVIGYPQTRFSQRTPEINHRQAQLAAGQVPSSPAENIKRHSRNKVQLDFANSTYDQQNRLLKYEVTRDLGPDTSPWKPPVILRITAGSESIDDFDQILKLQLRGDRVTVTDRVSWEYAGDYELMEMTFNFFNWSQAAGGGGTVAQSAGTIELVLRTYEETRFTDVSDAPSASFATLPGDTLYAGLGPVNTNYQVAFGTLTATDAGTSVTVAITGLQARVGGGPALSYGDCTITGLPYTTTEYLFIDDPTARGGGIPLQATTIPGALTGLAGRMFIAQITTPAASGAPTGGGGGGGGGLPPPPPSQPPGGGPRPIEFPAPN